MSIELMKRALEFITGVYFGEHEGSRADREKLEADLTTAIQQAEAQQPATGEPVGFTYQAEIAYADSTGGNGSFWRVPPDLDDEAVPLYTHPAPSVRADVVRVPLQVLKDASEALGNFVSDHGWGDADMQAMDNLDAYIARHEANRAAMLAAK